MFGQKVKETLANPLGIIDYDNLTYGDISSTIRNEGMKMCRDLKIQSQANKSKAKYSLEKPLVKLPTTRQASLKPKDQTALRIVAQKLDDLVKREPITPSSEPTSRNPRLESRVETLHAHTASDSSSTTPSETEREIEHIENQFQGLQVNRLYQSKVTPTSLTKNWYPRPTPTDLQFEERTTQFTVSSGKLYEWNIDGLFEQEIQNKIQHITMVANNYLNDGITNTEVVELIVLGFTGKLLDWWNNCMTAASKDDIKHAIQKDEDENPIFDESIGRGVPDGVNTLIYTIMKHFIGKPSNITSRIYDQLSNLRCKNLGEYRWYEDVFTTRVMHMITGKQRISLNR